LVVSGLAGVRSATERSMPPPFLRAIFLFALSAREFVPSVASTPLQLRRSYISPASIIRCRSIVCVRNYRVISCFLSRKRSSVLYIVSLPSLSPWIGAKRRSTWRRPWAPCRFRPGPGHLALGMQRAVSRGCRCWLFGR